MGDDLDAPIASMLSQCNFMAVTEQMQFLALNGLACYLIR